MGSLARTPCLTELPDEILLHILGYIEPDSLPKVQFINHRLRDLSLDEELWKLHCFEQSSWYHWLKNRRSLKKRTFRLHSTPKDSERDTDADGRSGSSEAGQLDGDALGSWRRAQIQKRQDLANWDPTFPSERVSWYDEYIQRHGPASVNWFEIPRPEAGGPGDVTEVRGMALFNPNDGDDGLGTMLAVSPLDDGSVCLWDVNGSRNKRGGIVARSQCGILFADGPGNSNTQRSKKIDTGVTECVSVNHNGHRAFFAVQSHLLEVDLNELKIVSRESFEWSITTLSQVHDGVPLTVGTSLGIHLHDFRARARVHQDLMEQLDGPLTNEENPYRAIFDPEPLPPYASLSQPTPVRILHLPRAGCKDTVSDDIYVAGRFSNILHYDRRNFPKIMGTIHSGARLSALVALPYPYSTLDHEVRKYGKLSAEKIEQAKTAGDGRTLIAGGEYNSKGSLEIYGLSSAEHSMGSAVLQNSVMKNRHTAASSIILSVVNHGTKIAFSDGSGFVKWFERDGTTECRRIRIGSSNASDPGSLFSSTLESEDLARKIMSTEPKHGRHRPNEDNLMLWTGEKLAMVSFTGEPLFSAKDFEVQNPDTAEEEIAHHEYTERMREALQRQADEVGFVDGLGHENWL